MAKEKESETAPLLGEITHPGRPKAGPGSRPGITPVFSREAKNSL